MSKTDKPWIETIHEIHTVIHSSTRSDLTQMASGEYALMIGEMIIRAAQDYTRNKG